MGQKGSRKAAALPRISSERLWVAPDDLLRLLGDQQVNVGGREAHSSLMRLIPSQQQNQKEGAERTERRLFARIALDCPSSADYSTLALSFLRVVCQDPASLEYEPRNVISWDDSPCVYYLRNPGPMDAAELDESQQRAAHANNMKDAAACLLVCRCVAEARQNIDIAKCVRRHGIIVACLDACPDRGPIRALCVEQRVSFVLYNEQPNGCDDAIELAVRLSVAQ